MYVVVSRFVFFFFKQKTAYEMRISDWSSDVCSSDLPAARRGPPGSASAHRSPDPAADDRLRRPGDRSGRTIPADGGFQGASYRRSEERRVGKECVSSVALGGRRSIKKNNKRNMIINRLNRIIEQK